MKLSNFLHLHDFFAAVDEQNSDTLRYDKELAERGYHGNDPARDIADLCAARLAPPPMIEIVSPAEDDDDEEDEEIIAITTNGATRNETTKPISPMASLTVPRFTWSAADNDSCGLPSPMMLSPIPDDPRSRRSCTYLQSSVVIP